MSTVSAAALSTPQTTAVIAVEVEAPTVNAEARGAFDAVIGGVARLHGSLSREEGGPNFVLAVTPETSVSPVLSQLTTAFSEFEQTHTPLRVRALVHHGVVFRSMNGGEVVYLGSVIRSARNALRRMPGGEFLMATREFAEFAAGLPIHHRSFQLTAAAPECEGLLRLLFDTQNARATQAAGTNPELLEYLKRRLAEEVGPFASALVDGASQTPLSASEIIAALAKEVDNPDARRRFREDALEFANGGSPGQGRSAAGASASKPEKGGLLGRLLRR